MASFGRTAEKLVMGIVGVAGAYFVTEPRIGVSSAVEIVENLAEETTETAQEVVEAVVDVAEEATEEAEEAAEETLEVATVKVDPPKAPVTELSRFDGDLAVIAGTAEPGADVFVTNGDIELARGIAGSDGQFALTFDYEVPEEGAALTLLSENAGGMAQASEAITVLPQSSGETTVATMTEDGVDVEVRENRGKLSLTDMSYGAVGAATLSGTGIAGSAVDILVDGSKIGQADVGEDGTWRFDISDLAEGDHEISLLSEGVDAVTQTVTRQAVDAIEAQTAANRDAVTTTVGETVYKVVRGDSLWRIAKNKYGEGVRYVDIYDWNDNLINDPDLIYPGQELKIK